MENLPEEICVWSVGNGTGDTCFCSTEITIKSLPRSWSIPIPEDILAGNFLGNGPRFKVTFAVCQLQIFLDLCLPKTGFLYRFNNSVIKSQNMSLLDPIFLNRLQLIPIFPSQLRLMHQLIQPRQSRRRTPQNKRMISRINIRCQ